jgi:hypothetical protein
MTEDNIPPIVKELFALLPPPGSLWPHEERDAWIRCASAIFDLLYKRVDEGTK